VDGGPSPAMTKKVVCLAPCTPNDGPTIGDSLPGHRLTNRPRRSSVRTEAYSAANGIDFSSSGLTGAGGIFPLGFGSSM